MILLMIQKSELRRYRSLRCNACRKCKQILLQRTTHGVSLGQISIPANIE